MSQEDILDYLRKTPHNTNVNVVKGMVGNTGSSLPEVTAADNGKVLAVVEGEWDKAIASGGSSLIIHEDSSYPPKLDKTYGEICEALLNGTNVLLDIAGHYYFVKDFQPDTSNGGGSITFNNGNLYMAGSDDAYPEIYD